MARILAASVLVLVMGGCMWGNKNVQQSGDVTITEVPGDVPQFKRTYEVRINTHVTMKVTMRTTSYGVSDMSELDQTGGGWVLFDLHKPADKILDREILPVVQRYCTEIEQADKAYRRSHPSEFVDENGDKWRRVD